MGITLPVFKLAWNIAVEKDKLHIVARCLDIWFWTECKILVRILLGPQELLILRDYIILQTSSLFLEVFMKELLLFVEKKTSEGFVWKLYFWLNSHNNWSKKVIENLDDCDWVIDVFFIISDYNVSLILCFIDTRNSIPIQVFLISFILLLKNLVKYFSFPLLRSVDKRFL